MNRFLRQGSFTFMYQKYSGSPKFLPAKKRFAISTMMPVNEGSP